MKVICITDKPESLQPFDLVVGSEYTVTRIRESFFGIEGTMVYEIEEMNNTGYWTGYFAEVSSIDETTFERNYKTQTV